MTPALNLATEGHVIRVRDMRERFATPDVWAAHCSCGWAGEARGGFSGERTATWDGVRHVREAREAHTSAALSQPEGRSAVCPIDGAPGGE
jgi:hypothetical protein